MALEDIGAFEDEDEIRRRLLEQTIGSQQTGLASGLGTGLGAQAIEAETEAPEEMGPTPEMPFRFTQQELNPRAQATSGQWRRDPRARSPHLLPRPAGPSDQILYQNRLPMVERNIAMGDLKQYQGLEGYSDIANPGSLYGRSQIAGLSGFAGDTTPTLMFDMQQIGKGMGWSDEKVNRLLGFKGQQQQPAGEQPWGKGLGDEEALFYGLMAMSSKPGGKAGRVEGDKNFTGREGVNYGQQKTLDIDLDDPRHMEKLMDLGRVMTLGNNREQPTAKDLMRGTPAGNFGKGDLFKYQREFDRDFRDAGRISGNEGLAANIVKGVVIAAMAAATGGALAPALLGTGGLGLVGSATSGAMFTAGNIGASALTGLTAGGIGGLTSGALSSLTSEGGFNLADTLKAGGIGALSGGVLGAIGHVGRNLWAGRDALGALANSPAAQQAAATSAGQITDPGLRSAALKWAQTQSMQAGNLGGVGATTGMGTQHASERARMAATGAGGATSGAGTTGTSLGDIFGQVGRAVSSPAAKAVATGGLQGAMATQAQAGSIDEMLAQGRAAGMRSSAQSTATRRTNQRKYDEMFGQGLPDSPFYDPVEDVLSAQGGAIT